jgi:hypothetical protein
MSDNNQRQQETVPETSEELVSLAQEYFSHEFPNSAQRCPSWGEIVELIESGKLPDEALRRHLLTCSSCFATYKGRLQEARELQPVVAPWRRRISELLRKPSLRILVPSLPVLLLVLVAIFYLRPKKPQDNVTFVEPPVEVVNANANVVSTSSPSPVPVDSSNQLDRRTLVARVDLRNYLLQRGNEPGEEPPPLQIEQKTTAFTITLPEDSPPGTYSVSILDAFGKSIRTRSSYSADGKRLSATLNLDNLRNQKYRLCVSRSEEPPNCYPIVITNRGK